MSPNPSDESAFDAGDYYCWLRLRDLGKEDDTPALRACYNRSRRKGKHRAILDRRRRQAFGPGKYHAASEAGWYANKRHVKGWRGVNPDNP